MKLRKRQKRRGRHKRGGLARLRRQSLRLRIELEGVELAKGHDGFLRGKPEPVILIGAYLMRDCGAQPIGRVAFRTQRADTFPCLVSPRTPTRLVQNLGSQDERAHIAVLALALEEDSGHDVEHLYAALEHPSELAVWPLTHDVPEPQHLEELAPEEWRTARRVNVIVAGDDAADACTRDDWVGSTTMVIPARQGVSRARLHFVSHDGRNDWTALITTRL